jgi:hypothetical protein
VSTSAAYPAGRSPRWLDHDPVSRTLLALYLGMFIVEVSGAHSAWALLAPQALFAAALVSRFTGDLPLAAPSADRYGLRAPIAAVKVRPVRFWPLR